MAKGDLTNQRFRSMNLAGIDMLIKKDRNLSPVRITYWPDCYANSEEESI
jgi:hypothetical protein